MPWHMCNTCKYNLNITPVREKKKEKKEQVKPQQSIEPTVQTNKTKTKPKH